MKSMFAQTVSLQLRLFVAVLLSVILIIGDKYTEGGTNVRTSLNTLVSPLIYVANLPYEVFSFGAKSLHTRDQLLTENEAKRSRPCSNWDFSSLFIFADASMISSSVLVSPEARISIRSSEYLS